MATRTGLPREPWVVGVALACGLVSGVAYLAFFTALRLGPLSVVSPVVSVYGGLTVVLSILLLGEALGPLQALGVAVATGGVVLASVVVEGRSRRPRLAGPGIAYALVALDGASTDPAAVDPRADPGPARLDRRAVALAIVGGLLDISGFIAFGIGLQVAPTWLVGLVSSFGPVVAVITGVAVFGKRPRRVQWAGLGLVFGSVFLIALGR